MLSLKDIKKDYVVGDSTVSALKGVSIDFRENEFVSILGPSGCGKSPLLRQLKTVLAPHGAREGAGQLQMRQHGQTSSLMEGDAQAEQTGIGHYRIASSSVDPSACRA